eukprot:TRINITY_DN19967_c0_g1_i1.p1 TRINITY_DN19967_c0_g1~~TRINITY_DN19967_c0_g1_i1.p1  ORF type:complete len:397 (+),score=108.22 TRINITY_DN19967_c0_g1_i1:100-1191(+)
MGDELRRLVSGAAAGGFDACWASAALQLHELPGRGRGVVAQADIAAGDVLLRDTPLLAPVADVGPLVARIAACPLLSKHYRCGEPPASGWTPAEQPQGSQVSPGQWRLHSWQLQQNCFAAGEGPSGEPTHVALHRVVCLLNHSCDPNAHSVNLGDPESGLRSVVYALRDMRAGDEVTISYRAPFRAPRAVRRAWLQRAHGFVCECELCRRGDDATTEAAAAEVDPEAVRRAEMLWNLCGLMADITGKVPPKPPSPNAIVQLWEAARRAWHPEDWRRWAARESAVGVLLQGRRTVEAAEAVAEHLRSARAVLPPLHAELLGTCDIAEQLLPHLPGGSPQREALAAELRQWAPLRALPDRLLAAP